MHYKNPSAKAAQVVVFYRDFKDYGGDGEYGGYGKCHRGLGINALMTVRVLRQNGIQADLCPVWDVKGLREGLAKYQPTHAIIQALWIPATDQAQLCSDFPNVQFDVRVHSQIGFLQVEPAAIKILRDLLSLQEGLLNLSVSSNTHRLYEYLHHVYKNRVLYLPNLYDLTRVTRKRDESHDHRLLRIGSFGAHRLLKNHTTAAAAALMIADRRGSDLEFYVNSGRNEGEKAGSILTALRNMFSGLRWAKLVEVPWEEWPNFRKTIAFMDLTMQVSFSETFNLCASDSVAEGVPVVASDAIEWLPHRWHANVDNAEDVCYVGSALLWDIHAAEEGLEKLTKYSAEAISTWLQYLASNPT